MTDNLLKFELRRMFRGKALYICVAVCAVIAVLGGLVILLAMKLIVPQIENIPDVYVSDMMLGFMSNAEIAVISGIFVSVFACADHSEHTVKNIYARGFSRSALYGCEYVSAVIGTAFIFAVSELVSFAFYSAVFDMGKIGATHVALLASQFVYLIAVNTFVFAVCMMTKKTVLGIVTAVLGCSVVDIVLSLASSVVNSSRGIYGNSRFDIGKYWLSSIAGDFGTVETEAKAIILDLALCVAYIVAFTVAGVLVNRKDEV